MMVFNIEFNPLVSFSKSFKNRSVKFEDLADPIELEDLNQANSNI